MIKENKGVILVVDDDQSVLNATSMLLINAGYDALPCRDSRNAVVRLMEGGVDIVLTDIKMPNITGIDLLKNIHEIYPEMPVILMTAYAELDIALDAIRKGAFDMIIKPYNTDYLIFTVEKAIRYKMAIQMEKNYKEMLEDTVKERTRKLNEALSELKRSSFEVIKRLTIVSEFRDLRTGLHIGRVGLYAARLSRTLGMSEDFIETIGAASMMHDIGKIGIPDEILLKAGILDSGQFEIMKTHTTLGTRMLSDSSYPNLQMAASIALNHHEAWDGSGYPNGLKGEDIPIEGRITMVCDVYDSLRSERPYKPSLSHDEAFRIIIEGDGRTMPGNFCPKALSAFKENEKFFEEIFAEHKD